MLKTVRCANMLCGFVTMMFIYEQAACYFVWGWFMQYKNKQLVQNLSGISHSRQANFIKIN